MLSTFKNKFKFINFLRVAIITIVVFTSTCGFIPKVFAQENTLNIYAWTGYIPRSILQQFTAETGIKIHLAEYDSNETMFAKLKASPLAGYDIVIPSSYFVERMIKQNMLHEIDLSKLKNFHNLNTAFLYKDFDPKNNYSIPYLWGCTGIVVNSKYFDIKSIQGWQNVWHPRFKDQLMLLNDMREVFGMAMLTLGYSVNDTNPEHIKQAYVKLKELLPNIKIFNSDAEQTIYIDEDAIIGMGYNGDINLTQQENLDVQFIYPKEGFVLWIDSIAITKNAQHIENAHKFIDFLLRPDIAKTIALEIGYSVPNAEAINLMSKDMQNNPVINPSKEILKRGYLQNDLGDAIPVYDKYWELLKIGE